MSVTRRIFLTAGSQGVARAFSIVLSLVVLKLTTNYLGVESFGQLALVLTIAELLRIGIDLGVPTVLAREMSLAPDAAARLAGPMFAYRLATTIGLLVVFSLVVPLLPMDATARKALLISVVGVLFMSLTDFTLVFLQVHLKLHLAAVLDVLGKTITLFVTVVAVMLDLGFLWLVVGLALAQVIVYLAAQAMVSRLWRVSFGPPRQAAWMARDGLVIGATTVVGLAHFKGDAILLAILDSTSAVGIYNVAYRFVDQAFFFPGLFTAAIFPLLSRSMEEGAERIDYVINRGLKALLLLGTVVAVGIATLAEVVVPLVASDAFEPATTPTRILALSLLVMFPATLYSNALIAGRHARDLLVIGVPLIVLNVVLNVVLVPAYSYNGAAWATVASESVGLVALIWLVQHRIGVSHDRRFLRDFGIVLAVVAVTYVASIPAPAIIRFVAVEGALFVSALGLRVVGRNDLQLLVRR